MTLIDYDEGRKALRMFAKRLHRVARVIGNTPIWIRYDRTRHGWHVVTFWQRPMSAWQVLCLQAILGSDWRRESMNFARLSSPQSSAYALKRWNILYSEKLQ